jgi:rubrerythrin
MQSTTLGQNRTGAAISPAHVTQMLEAVNDLSPQMPISTAPIDEERMKYISEADNVGSIPPPAAALKGALKKTVAMINGVSPGMFLDKIGERIAFERTGTRLYDALIAKYAALAELGGEDLRAIDALPAGSGSALPDETVESPLEVLRRIRNEEHGHFLMLCDVMEQLGGDPTAQTPCADVAGTTSMGVLQVVTDPRTTLAQCLNAALIAELTDTASWELLSELATTAGQPQISDRFSEALAAEQKHTVVVRGWLRALTLHAVGTNAV